jgi:bacillolysin
VPPAKIAADLTLTNISFDGSKIVYGMGMVNSNYFGPYDSSAVFSELTHSLISITNKGQSGAVSESLCDVIAVLISGDSDWTIGKVRNPNGPPQVLRSLRAPGTAFDHPILGKDPTVDHLSLIVPEEQFGDDIYTNSGIPNKAAYLLTEGGEHHGVTIGKGIGRENAAKLYMAVIARLRGRKEAVDFAAFRNLVVSTAAELLPDQLQQRAVADGFRAVGL